jgi:AhpD family alkylhydroperoxidase
MGRVLGALMSGTRSHVREVTPVPRGAARGLTARVYRQVERDFGMLAPPVLLHSPAPECLAASWLLLRETLLARGLVDRPAKEAVAAAVSAGNSCPYCVDVHGALLREVGHGAAADALGADRVAEVADPRLREIAGWARQGGTRAAAEATPLPVAVEKPAEAIGVAVTFHYLNRMANVFLPESPVPTGLPAGARQRALRVLGLTLRPYARRFVVPGAALPLLPAAPRETAPAWAAGSPTVAAAAASAAAAIGAAGDRSVAAPVRELVAGRLAEWDGRPPPLGRAWLDEAADGLPGPVRPAARLALLTAVASYRVTAADLGAVRAAGADDRALVELTSWASLAAAGAIGDWMWTGAARVAA